MTKNKLNLPKYIRLIFSLLFFIALFCLFGNKNEFPDSDAYTGMSIQVVPGYPLFLWFFRIIFGDGYIRIVSLAQNILAAVASWFVVEELGRNLKCRQIVLNIGLLVFIVPYVGTAFLSNSGLILSCALLTEGITLPLYYLLLAFMLKLLYDKDIAGYVGTGIVGGYLVLTRAQMFVPVMIIIIMGIIIAVRSKRQYLLIMQIVIIAVIYIGGNILYKANATGSSNTLGKATALTNLLCSVSREDAELFEGEERIIFDTMMDKLEEGNYFLDSHNPIERAVKIEAIHDDVKCDVLTSTMYQYVGDVKGIYEVDRQNDILAGYMDDYIYKLLPRHIGAIIYNTLSLTIIGIIRTNAVNVFPISVFSLILYVLFIILWLRSIKIKRSYAKLSGITLLLVVTNALGVASCIMCLSRYMIYNMSLFYFMLMLMLADIVFKEHSLEANA